MAGGLAPRRSVRMRCGLTEAFERQQASNVWCNLGWRKDPNKKDFVEKYERGERGERGEGALNRIDVDRRRQFPRWARRLFFSRDS